MKAYSLGKIAVPTPGTPVRVTTDNSLLVSRIVFTAVAAANDQVATGWVSIGLANFVRTTGVGLITTLRPPGAGLQHGRIEIAETENSIQLSDYWVDASVAGEGAIVAYWLR
jgi:hypothetical protein